MFIGKRIQLLRKQKGLSLSGLAKQSGIQIATLSRIEHEKMTGTVDSHINIAKALGVELTELYTETSSGTTLPEQKLSPKTDIFSFETQSSHDFLTSNVTSKKMMPVLLKLEPHGKTNPKIYPRGSELFIFVLSGNIEVTVGEKSYTLTPNHTLYIDASLRHFFSNKGNKPARMICVLTPVSL